MDADGLGRNEQCVSQAQTVRTLCGLFAESKLAGFIDTLQAATTAIPILACGIEFSREKPIILEARVNMSEMADQPPNSVDVVLQGSE